MGVALERNTMSLSQDTVSTEASPPAVEDDHSIPPMLQRLRDGLAGAATEPLDQQVHRFAHFRGTRPGECVEIQTLPSAKVSYPSVVCLRTTTIEGVVAALQDVETRPSAVVGAFYVANHVDPAIIARGPADQFQKISKGGGTTDQNIVSRGVMFFDFDAERASGISATAEEHEHARIAAENCYSTLATWLGESGASALGFADSGNGYHVYLALDRLPCTPEVERVIKAILVSAAALFSVPGVKVDEVVSDAKRLCPAFGTMKRKGEDTVHRPHRRTFFWSAPGDVRIDMELLTALADKWVSCMPEGEARDRAQGLLAPADTMSKAPKASRATASPATPRAASVGGSIFHQVNALPVRDVASNLGIAEGDKVTCPGCGETAGVDFYENGVKCFHARCASAGKQGFRTNVDLAMAACEMESLPAAQFLAAKFGLPSFSNRSANIANIATRVADANGEVGAWCAPMWFGELPTPVSFPVWALPAWLGVWVTAEAMATQTPADLAATHSIGALSGVLAKKVVVEVKPGWTEAVCTFTVVALPSGDRKSPVHRDTFKPLHDRERELAKKLGPEIKRQQAKRDVLDRQYKSAVIAAARDGTGSSEAEKCADELDKLQVPVLPRLVVDDTTTEKLGILMAEQGGKLLMASSEGGIFETMAGRYSEAPNYDLYLKAYSGDPYRVDRVGREPVHIASPALTLALTVQPSVVQGLAQKPGFRDHGLLARIMFSLPQSRVGFRDVDPPPMSADIAEKYNEKLLTLLDLQQQRAADGELIPSVLTLANDARALHMEFHGNLEPRLGPGGDLGIVADWGNKLPGNVARIAGLFHMSESSIDVPISADVMERAIVVGNYFIEHAKLAFALMQTDRSQADAQFVLKRIEQHGWTEFSKRSLFEAVKGRFKHVSELDPVLQLLVDRHFIRRKFAVQKAPGRPSETYEVNPACASQYSQYSQNPSLGSLYAPGKLPTEKAPTDIRPSSPPNDSLEDVSPDPSVEGPPVQAPPAVVDAPTVEPADADVFLGGSTPPAQFLDMAESNDSLASLEEFLAALSTHAPQATPGREESAAEAASPNSRPEPPTINVKVPTLYPTASLKSGAA